MLLLSLLFSCSSKKETVNPNETQVIEESEIVQGSLNGTFPAEELALLDFSAENSDGTTRGKDYLIGHPTVIWFFPYAQTTG